MDTQEMPRISKKIDKDKRKDQAEARALAYAALPVLDRLKRLDATPGKSKRERDRLGRLVIQPLPKPEKKKAEEPAADALRPPIKKLKRKE